MAAESASPTIDEPTTSVHESLLTGKSMSELVSMIPVIGANGVIAYGAEWSWPAAAILLGVAYLTVFLTR